MARTAAHKTFKIEVEVTVDMEEVGQEHLQKNQSDQRLTQIKHLQQALLQDDNALNRQMLAMMISKLQEYMDKIANQNSLEALEKVIENLEPEDRQFFEEGKQDFIDLTRPVRISSLSAMLNSSTISEKVTGPEGETTWQPVWKDLQFESDLGKQISKLYVTLANVYPGPQLEDGHYLLARNLTQQPDGIHYEGQCSCDQFLEGIGSNEEEALEALWLGYKRHCEAADIAGRILRYWRNERKMDFWKD